MKQAPQLNDSTAGTARSRFDLPEPPHAFKPEHANEPGYRPWCITCGAEAGGPLHRAIR